MEILLNDLLKKTYVDKDYKYLKDKCTAILEFNEEFYKKVEEYVSDVIKENIEGFPAQRCYFKFDKYKDGQFKVSYRTVLQISKIVPIFYIQHEFEVENNDSNKMCPVLDGFGAEPYIKNQANSYEIIKEYWEKKGYMEIDYSQLNEIVINVKGDSANIINGEKYSVEDLMFNDMLDI